MGHGHCKNKKVSPTYISWKMMIQRCTNKKRFDYVNYGGLGIGVYFGWLGKGGFAEFLKDVGERPSTKYHLSRIDHNKDYEPGNVKWEESHWNCGKTRKDTKKHKAVTIDGETNTYQEWADVLGIRYDTLLRRIRRGWGNYAFRVRKGETRCRVRSMDLLESLS